MIASLMQLRLDNKAVRNTKRRMSKSPNGAQNAKKKPTINNDYDLASDSDDSVYEFRGRFLIRPHQLHIITVRTVARGGGGGDLKRPSDRDIKVTLKKLCGLKTRLQMLNLLIT